MLTSSKIIARTKESRWFWYEFLIVFIFGLSYAKIMVPNQYFTLDFLLTRVGDAAQYSAGSLGYLNDSWRIPFMHSMLLGNGGLSMTVFDAIPLAGLIFKTINNILGLEIQNYIGIWVFLVFALQPISAWIATNTWKIKNLHIKFSIVISISFLSSFLFRVLHTALQSHFLLILAVALFPVIQRDHNLKKCLYLSISLLLISTLVHTYLAAMVLILLFWSYFERYRSEIKKVNFHLINFSAILIIHFFLFYTSFTLQELFTYPAGGGGWSVYSMNILAPIQTNSDKYVEGQYEGLNFLGPIGILYIGLFYFVSFSRGRLGILRDQFPWLRSTSIFLFFITALSWGSLVYFQDKLIFDYIQFETLPLISKFTESFRCPGRLFWIVTYLGIFAGAKMLDVLINSEKFKNRFLKSVKLRLPVLVILLLSQIFLIFGQLNGTYKYMRNETYEQNVTKNVLPSVKAATNVVIFPEFECLPGDGRDIVPYFHIAAAYSKTPINTTKGARQKIPYSCTYSDMESRFENYLKNSTANTLFVFSGDWITLASENIKFTKCNQLGSMKYCLGRKLT